METKEFKFLSKFQHDYYKVIKDKEVIEKMLESAPKYYSQVGALGETIEDDEVFISREDKLEFLRIEQEVETKSNYAHDTPFYKKGETVKSYLDRNNISIDDIDFIVWSSYFKDDWEGGKKEESKYLYIYDMSVLKGYNE